MDPADNPESLDKDRPLREDIRLLGRLLGDTLREQEGAGAFNLVESVRQTAVRFRRDGEAQARSRASVNAQRSEPRCDRIGGPGIYLFFPAQQYCRGFAS